MSFIYGFAIEHGAHFVLKDRILPEHLEHEAKSSAQNGHGAARFRSCCFYYFLREYIDKTNKKVHNKFTSKYRHIQEHGFALRREAQRNGV